MTEDRQRNQAEPRPEHWWQKITLTVGAIALALVSLAALQVAFPGLVWTDAKVTDWALVALTGAYVFVASLQWHRMGQALALTRESNNLTLRAWVMVKEEFPFDPYRETGRFVAKVVNNGKVPASGRYGFYTEVLRTPLTWPLPDKPAQVLMRFHLGPGMAGVLEHNVPFLDPLDAEDIKLGLAYLVFVLTLEYSDVFESKGYTRINASYDPESNELKAGPEGNPVA
jgi:hypothetical protein